MRRIFVSAHPFSKQIILNSPFQKTDSGHAAKLYSNLMNTDIQQHFQNIQQIIWQGKAGALQAVNAHALMVNWQVGAYLSRRLPESTYGDKVVSNLAKWLQEKEPGLKGYDRRSLYRMRVFFDSWQSVDWSILPDAFRENSISETESFIVSEQKIVVTASPQSPNIPPVLLRLTWSHHIDLLSGCTSNEERLFYLILAIKERYDVRDLRRQIKSGLFERQMLAKHTLLVPEHPKKELLPEVFRDRYSEKREVSSRRNEAVTSRSGAANLCFYETKFELDCSGEISPFRTFAMTPHQSDIPIQKAIKQHRHAQTIQIKDRLSGQVGTRLFLPHLQSHQQS